MTRPKAVVVVSALALLTAVAAAWLSYGFLQKEVIRAKAVQPRNIVVATADIPVGQTIKENQLKTAAWPKESVPAGTAQDPQLLVGRVAIRPITSGDAVTEAKLKPKSGGGNGFLTYVVPQGHRAVTVAVNEVAGVAGFLTPSDRVDVIATMALPENDRESLSKIVLENVPVLATGQVTDQREGKPVIVPTVTLDLVPEEAEKLVLCASKGSLQLLLRNISDSAHVASKGATIGRLLGGAEAAGTREVRHRPTAIASAKQAAVSPAPGHTLVIVRGTDKSSRQYPE